MKNKELINGLLQKVFIKKILDIDNAMQITEELLQKLRSESNEQK